MPDKNYNIGITTTGDTSGVQIVEKSLDQLVAGGQKIDALANGPISNLDGKITKAGASTRNMGMAMNSVSYQLQDFTVQVGAGQSAVTAFAQQAPQLIDGLRMAGVMSGTWGMAMMGVAAALPIVMFGGRALINWIRSESASTLDETLKTQKKKVEEAAKHYESVEKKARKKREDEAKEEAKELERIFGGIDARKNADNSRTDLTAERDTVAVSIKQINQRLDLERIERALVVASGDDALRLAKERLKVIQDIQDAEREIKDIQDKAKFDKAQTDLDAAGEKVQAIGDSDSKKAKQYDELVKAQEELRQKSADLKEALKDEYDQTKQLIREKEKQLDVIDRTPKPDTSNMVFPGGAGTPIDDGSGSLKNELSTLRKTLHDLNERMKPAREVDAQAESMQPRIDGAKSDLEASAKKHLDAVQALTKAELELSHVKQSQDTQNKLRDRQDESKQITDLGKPVSDAGRAALNIGGTFQKNEKSPGFNTVKDRINTLITDNKPDGEQVKELLGLLKDLQGELKGKDKPAADAVQKLIDQLKAPLDEWNRIHDGIKDLGTVTVTAVNGITNTLTNTKTRMDGLNDRITDLETQSKQTR
ncbi:MAG: hypothetical protein WCS43_16795 [Verrucomicrobiota bacterium]